MTDAGRHEDASPDATPGSPALAWLPVAVPLLAAFALARDAFSTTRVYYLRDLSAPFWQVHLWFAQAVRSGESVLWDPYYCFGSPAIADPVRQILFPPAALLRLLLPSALGFNLLVALPAPVAAAGAYALLHRRFRPWAASAGATVFVLSGAVVSTANMPNLSWSVALTPWTLYATSLLVERRTRRRFAALAVAFALQYLAGEPVTLVVTAGIAVGFGATFGGDAAGRRVRAALAVAGAGACAVLLVLPQALMLAAATSASLRSRGMGASNLGDVLRPLDFVGVVSPGLLGDYLAPTSSAATIGAVLRGGRIPYMLSMYVGIAALAIAGLGATARATRRWSLFWLAVLAVVVFLALGDTTPLYVPLHDALPIFESFRSPSKLMALGMLAVAALVASGWSVVEDADVAKRPTAVRIVTSFLVVVGGLALVAAVLDASKPNGSLALGVRIGEYIGAQDVETTSSLFAAAVLPAAVRVAVTALAFAGLLALSRSRADVRPLVAAALYALVALDLFTAGASLNPTIDATLVGEPEWVAATRSSPESRVYSAGIVSDSAQPNAFDEIPSGVFATGAPEATVFAIVNNAVAKMPSAWRVRQAACYDFTMLAPRPYWMTLSAFSHADAVGRARFLSRVGCRYFFVWHAPPVPARVLYQPFPDAPALYDAGDGSPRAAVVPASAVVPDATEQVRALFDPAFDPSRVVLLERPSPPPAGNPSAPGAAAARVVADAPTSVTVEASAPEGGGFLVLSDAYDPYWRADVDGHDVEVLRANALFRAVPVAAGAHTVRFHYEPTPFYLGCAACVVTALVLAVLGLSPGRGPRRS